MYTVYALYSAKYEKIYIGFTSDLTKRLSSHNHLSHKGYTAKYRPWELVDILDHTDPPNPVLI